jgi:predicted DCC family thiol-disulfide oxidoreductase YuxK
MAAFSGKGQTLELREIGSPQPPGSTVVFYDGVCGLCNRFNSFVLRRDHHARIRFAPLQGDLARRILPRYGCDPLDLDTIYVIADWGSSRERVLARSQAVLHALSQLGGGWNAFARLAAIVPRTLADAVYRLIAGTRYQLFGKSEVCQLPPAAWRDRFLD